jgi:hypothetical protein
MIELPGITMWHTYSSCSRTRSSGSLSEAFPALVLVALGLPGALGCGSGRTVFDGGCVNDSQPPLLCTQTVDAFCAQNTCPAAWSKLPSNPDDVCTAVGTPGSGQYVDFCGYEKLLCGQTDVGWEFEYDIGSGQLMAIVHDGNVSQTCVAGNTSSFCWLGAGRCTDGGVDGG